MQTHGEHAAVGVAEPHGDDRCRSFSAATVEAGAHRSMWDGRRNPVSADVHSPRPASSGSAAPKHLLHTRGMAGKRGRVAGGSCTPRLPQVPA
jgi:hypothetical protein